MPRSLQVLVSISLVILVTVGVFITFMWSRLPWHHQKSATRGTVATQASKATQISQARHQTQPGEIGHNISEPIKKHLQEAKAHHTFHPLPMQGAATAIGSCRLDPMAGVWGPSRLRVYNPCQSVSGTVESIVHEPSDADYHIDLLPDKPYQHLLNSVNNRRVHGDLVVEVIPLDSKRVPIPVVGQHIQVTGAYVMDTGHGWMEIHPAWLIDGKGSASYTPAELTQSMQEIQSSFDALVARFQLSLCSSLSNADFVDEPFQAVKSLFQHV